MTARFMELCLDVHEADVPTMDRLGAFWAAVSGGRLVTPEPGEVANVIGRAEHESIAMCPVPEVKTVKHRVHLDVHARDVDSLIALGATRVSKDGEFRWVVMRDPEGGEFCAFLKDPLPDFRIHGIAVDSTDPESQSRWWAERFGATAMGEGGWWSVTGATPDPVLTLDFVKVPEPKTVKNRIHWDVEGDPAEFLAAGATLLWEVPGRTRPIAWTTMADPEGNEFCVFPRVS